MSETPRTDKLVDDIESGMLSGAVHYGTAYSAATKLARKLERENSTLRAWIKRNGEHTNTCTYDVLREICDGCGCHRAPKIDVSGLQP